LAVRLLTMRFKLLNDGMALIFIMNRIKEDDETHVLCNALDLLSKCVAGFNYDHNAHVLCHDYDYIRSRSRFGTSPNIIHLTHVVISFWGADAFYIIIFSSSLDLDLDCIIRYEQWFPFSFTTPQLIPLYSICSLCRNLTCFAYPFNSVGHWSI